MDQLRQIIARGLLLVFVWAILPGSLVHEIFADHHDTACESGHYNGGTQVEAAHTHCDIFQAKCPVYEQPAFVATPVFRRLISTITGAKTILVFPVTKNEVLNRGPPFSLL